MLADQPCIGTESTLILDWMTGLEGGDPDPSERHVMARAPPSGASMHAERSIRP